MKTIWGPCSLHNNYYEFTSGEYYGVQLHRIIFIKFYKLKLSDIKNYIIHHIDLNSKNNCILNLRLMTKSEHLKLHAKLRTKINGYNSSGWFGNRKIDSSGEKNGFSKISNKERKEIYNLVNNEKILQKNIAKMYNISQQTVSRIKNDVRWC